MYTQAKSKKAVSVIVGYVILISFAIVIGIIVYQWMKTYVPKEDINCPDGVSLFITKYEYTPDTLTLYIKNNGKFDIGGYFIYATDSPEKKLATIDMTQRHFNASSKLRPYGIKFGGLIPRNALGPNDEEKEVYNITDMNEEIYSIEILPIRWQVEKNRITTVSCKNAKIREIISHGVGGECTPVPDPCGSAVCGTAQNGTCEDVICLPGCGIYACVEGQCTTSICTPVPDPCGSAVCGTAQNGTCDAVSCGACPIVDHASSVCPSGTCIIFSCDVGWCNTNGITSDGCEAPLGTLQNCGSCRDVCTSGQELCVNGVCNSCNGVWISPENSGIECDGTPKPANCSINCICTGGYESNQTGGCRIPTSVQSCGSYCVWLETPVYVGGTCRQSIQQCTGNGEVHEIGGDVLPYCDPANQVGDTCCCKP